MKKYKLISNFLFITGLLIVCFGLTSFTPSSSQASEMASITIKLNHGHFPPVNPSSKAGQWWGDQLVKRTQGRVKVTHYYAGAMSTGGEVIDLIQKGMSDVAEVVLPFYPSKLYLNAGTGCHAVPFGPNDPLVFLKLQERLRKECPELEAEFKAFNGKYLFYAGNADYTFDSKKPIRSIKDLAGKKVCSNGEYTGIAMSAAGAAQVAMETGERYTALQTGVADVSFLEPTMSYPFKLYEVLPYTTYIHWGAYPSMIYVMNLNTWNKLPKDIQKIVEEVSHDAAEQYIKDRAATFDSVTRLMKTKHGITFYDFSFDEQVEWANKMPDMAARFIEKGKERNLASEKVMKTYLRLSKEIGHKWPREWLKGNY